MPPHTSMAAVSMQTEKRYGAARRCVCHRFEDLDRQRDAVGVKATATACASFNHGEDRE
jgi:hypothetical protein